MKIEYRPIGTIHSPFVNPAGMPIQPLAAAGVCGQVKISTEYRAGLKDLEGFSHIILLYHFHKSRGFNLEIVPFMDTQSRGLFSTRAPSRPNAIGLSIVRLRAIEQDTLQIEDVDILDGTPLLDIKPYAPHFDRPRGEVRTGWLKTDDGKILNKKADGRFSGSESE